MLIGCARLTQQEKSMSIVRTFLPQFDHEMGTTRRVLEVVPEAEAAWRPHPKSYSLGDLASHIATLALWCTSVARQPELDLGLPVNASIARVPFTTSADLVAKFDGYVREARSAVEAISDEGIRESWALKNRGTIIFELPRIAVLRSFILSHMIHHRGQLTVYLRLRDVAIPSVYGPTADTV
jgi:uncharacterized damage-inducible protein DinB